MVSNERAAKWPPAAVAALEWEAPAKSVPLSAIDPSVSRRIRASALLSAAATDVEYLALDGEVRLRIGLVHSSAFRGKREE